jgi:hypothetical protein
VSILDALGYPLYSVVWEVLGMEKVRGNFDMLLRDE